MSTTCEFMLAACGTPENIEELVSRLTDPDHEPRFFTWFDCSEILEDERGFRKEGDRRVFLSGQCNGSIEMLTKPQPCYADYDASVHTTLLDTSAEMDLPIEVYAETWGWCAEHYLCHSGKLDIYETRDCWEDFGDPEEGPEWEV